MLPPPGPFLRACSRFDDRYRYYRAADTAVIASEYDGRYKHGWSITEQRKFQNVSVVSFSLKILLFYEHQNTKIP